MVQVDSVTSVLTGNVASPLDGTQCAVFTVGGFSIEFAAAYTMLVLAVIGLEIMYRRKIVAYIRKFFGKPKRKSRKRA